MGKGTQPTLADAITEPALRAAAGERAFARGAAYFEDAAVTNLAVRGGTASARVAGGREYVVRLWAEGQGLGHSCTCPVGDAGEFCKHAVAAGLAWLAQQAGETLPRRIEEGESLVRQWLDEAPREKLVELLLEQTDNDPGLRSRLEAQAARANAKAGIDLKALKATVGKALAVSGFVSYQRMRGLLARAHAAADLIAGLLDDGHTAAATELSGYALKRGIAAYTRIDDSGGAFGDLLRSIAALHLKACRAAPPQPKAFGKQLFDLMLADDWGLVHFEDYAPLLDDAGLKTFRARAEREWARVPEFHEGDKNGGHRRPTEHFQITRIMETLARHAGDVDALVAIKSRDLAHPYRFLEIAEILVEAGRRDEALAWAERGQNAFPDRPDSRLVDFLAAEYHHLGRHEDATALAWQHFKQRPMLDAYQRLAATAGKARAWPAWRDKALRWIRKEYLAELERTRTRWSWQPGGHSLLVEVFLWEGDSDAALAEAQAGGCTESLWFKLAEAREHDHPGEAAQIYRNRLDTIVDRRNNDAYDEAAELVARIGGLMRRAKQEKEFAAWLDDIRKRHKAKRNFMQRLDAVTAVAAKSG